MGGDNIHTGMTCEEIGNQYLSEDWCSVISGYEHEYGNKNITDACCACDGSKFRSLVPSDSPSSNPSVSVFPSLSPSDSPSAVPSTRPSECVDELDWQFDHDHEETTIVLNCLSFTNSNDPVALCERFKDIDFKQKTASLACCACGGGQHISVIPSGMPSDQPSRSPSDSPSKSPAPSNHPSKAPSFGPTEAPSRGPSFLPTESVSPTSFPSKTHGTVYMGDPCNYDIECRSDGIAMACINKICTRVVVSK